MSKTVDQMEHEQHAAKVESRRLKEDAVRALRKPTEAEAKAAANAPDAPPPPPAHVAQ